MPKNVFLFGAHLQGLSQKLRGGTKRSQITRIIPPKAYGRVPKALSQTALMHDDDYNRYANKKWSGRWNNRFIYPTNFRKDFESEALNSTLYNVRVTSSALYAMDDAGGFDNYILRTSPEELRSNMGEKMREVMYFYMKNPEAKSWGLPWKVFLRRKMRADPAYARYVHEAKKEASVRSMAAQHSHFSPYYLPTQALMHPARQEFVEGSVQPQLNLWWREGKALEAAFRRRLGEAKSFERAHADHREPFGFRYGETMGGGGRNNTWPLKRKKQHNYRQLRPY